MTTYNEKWGDNGFDGEGKVAYLVQSHKEPQ